MVNYVHYGSFSFDESQFSPVHNEMFTKPSGGFLGITSECTDGLEGFCY